MGSYVVSSRGEGEGERVTKAESVEVYREGFVSAG